MWPSPPSTAEDGRRPPRTGSSAAEVEGSDADPACSSLAGVLGDKAGEAEEAAAAVAGAARERLGMEAQAASHGGDGKRQCPERFLELLEDAVAAQDVGMRSRLGQSFARWLKACPEKEAEYNERHSLPGRDAAAEAGVPPAVGPKRAGATQGGRQGEVLAAHMREHQKRDRGCKVEAPSC